MTPTEGAGRAVRAEDVAGVVTVPDVALSPDGRLVAYTRGEVDLDRDDYRSAVYLVPADGGEPSRLTRGSGRDWAPRWSPDGRWLAFLSDRAGTPPELYLLTVSGGEPQRLTSLTGGAGPAVWSPDGSRIAFCARVSTDAPPHEPAARDRWAMRPRVVRRAQYKDDGATYAFDAVSQMFVASLESGAVVQLTTGDGDHSGPAWSPDGRCLAYVRERCSGPMDFRLSDLWVSQADGSHARRLSDAAGRALSPSWSPEGRTIAFYAHDPGDIGDVIMRVWVVAPEGGPAHPLTHGYDRSIALARQPEATPPPAWSPDGRTLLVTVADSGCAHVARIAAADGTVETVVGGARQVHSLSAGPHRLAFAATDWHAPADVHICRRDGADERRLTDLNGAWLSEVALPHAEHRQFDSPHGGALDGWVIHPAAPRRPAPLLVEIHGGPHNAHGSAFPGGSLHMFMLACRGWAVLALNPTGSGSFGKAFAYALRGRWGQYDLPEQLAAVDALVRDGTADPARLAVSGYSYGGFMAAWTTSHTDRFKAAVVGAPIVNAESFYGTSDIGPWFGPWEAGGDLVGHRETFRRLSPIHYVERVTTPSLVVHGEADDRCPIGQGEEWYIGLLAAGRAPAEFVRYPGQNHGFRVTGRPSHRIDVVRRMSDWLERYTLDGR